MSLVGKVYKLSASGCDKIYIGSTYCNYVSVRLAHHRQAHRNNWKDYGGLFDNGNPDVEILEEINLNSKDEAYKLRQLEESYAQQYDNLVNVRRCYLTEQEKKEQRDISVKKYHNSPKGQLALRKAFLNTKLKKIKQGNLSKTIHPSQVKQIENELKFINHQQAAFQDQTSKQNIL